MSYQPILSRLLHRVGPNAQKASPFTALLDKHLVSISGGRQDCGCGHDSSCSHISTGGGSTHDSREQC